MTTCEKPNPVEQRFSAAATTYACQSRVHEKLADTILQEAEPGTPRRILDIGAGTGILTRKLCQQFPQAAISALDISQPMLDALELPEAAHARVSMIHEDFMTLECREPYDLICSSAVLHWIQPLDRLMQQVDRHLAPGGYFCGAVMTANTFWQLREAQAHAMQVVELPPMLPDVDQWQDALHYTPWLVKNIQVRTMTETYPDSWSFLKYMHETGVTGNPGIRAPLSRRQLNRLAAYYDARFTEGQGVVAEYEVLYFYCSKP